MLVDLSIEDGLGEKGKDENLTLLDYCAILSSKGEKLLVK